MKKNTETIDYEWLSRPTGDPFADVGGYVIQYLSELNPDKDILGLIDLVTKIYVYPWNAGIGSFFLNSTVTQPSFKGDDKYHETIKYFTGMITGRILADADGYCRVSGQKGSLYKAGRHNFPMSGSGTFVNFHSFLESGLMLSKEVLIRMFFVPLGTIFVRDKIALIYSNNERVTSYFARRNCRLNLEARAMNQSEGVLKSKFSNPVNALFEFVDDLALSISLENLWGSCPTELSLYHFTNYGTGPDVVMYKLPAAVFAFYCECKSPVFKNDWNTFVRSHYSSSKAKGAVFHEAGLYYEESGKNEVQRYDYGDYEVWRNRILENLANGRSLLPLFRHWGVSHVFNSMIVELYLNKICNMDKKTIDKVKQLAQFLTSDDDDVIKKNIKLLCSFKYSWQMRRFLLNKVVVPNYNQGAKEPIITLEELVDYLFPDSGWWKNVQDFLLFAIYQELHEKNKLIEDIEMEELVLDGQDDEDENQ